MRFPKLVFPEGRTPDEELRRRCNEGAVRRYGEASERYGASSTTSSRSSPGAAWRPSF
ncbi:MAG: hypothetical protein WKH64_11415 [Chloroflexia bacterium]